MTRMASSLGTAGFQHSRAVHQVTGQMASDYQPEPRLSASSVRLGRDHQPTVSPIDRVYFLIIAADSDAAITPISTSDDYTKQHLISIPWPSIKIAACLMQYFYKVHMGMCAVSTISFGVLAFKGVSNTQARPQDQLSQSSASINRIPSLRHFAAECGPVNWRPEP